MSSLIHAATTTTIGKTGATPDATKDTGKVRVGNGMLKFISPTKTRDAIEDAGRVRVGNGMLRF